MPICPRSPPGSNATVWFNAAARADAAPERDALREFSFS
jgi:hypothetical protein